mmetsp:Transcript_30281/g.45870  ORF Transcript_30281/g.45870 Transcript_30281/m.45870 type:complete len:203 (+) Transcript_30281:2134-2742(+)
MPNHFRLGVSSLTGFGSSSDRFCWLSRKSAICSTMSLYSSKSTTPSPFASYKSTNSAASSAKRFPSEFEYVTISSASAISSLSRVPLLSESIRWKASIIQSTSVVLPETFLFEGRVSREILVPSSNSFIRSVPIPPIRIGRNSRREKTTSTKSMCFSQNGVPFRVLTLTDKPSDFSATALMNPVIADRRNWRLASIVSWRAF